MLKRILNRRWCALKVFLLSLALNATCLFAEETQDVTPIRLSYLEGQVSLWRPGADDWAPARINFPLSTGDTLFSAARSMVELQFDKDSYVRAAEDSQLRILDYGYNRLHLEVSTGHVALQLLALPPQMRVDISTPHAAVSLNSPGYIRFNVDGNQTEVITNSGATANLTTADGTQRALLPNQAVAIRSDLSGLQVAMAPEPDSWDRWNMRRTEDMASKEGTRYLDETIYGSAMLSRYGTWQQTELYGPVWQPGGVASNWVPYSTGSWLWDRYYGWTWVDTAPWGWAPFHYGRWVHLNYGWAWAPGPRLARPLYSPALVAFFGGAGSGYINATVSWVPLSWGEPVCPWWGSSNHRGRPQWRGWGGPRIINNQVVNNVFIVKQDTAINYHNSKLPQAVVAVDRRDFGRRPVQRIAIANVTPEKMHPLRGSLPIQPVSTTVLPDSGRTVRPPSAVINRPVVATNRVVAPAVPLHAETPAPRKTQPVAEPRLIRPQVVRRSEPDRSQPATDRSPGQSAWQAAPPVRDNSVRWFPSNRTQSTPANPDITGAYRANPPPRDLIVPNNRPIGIPQNIPLPQGREPMAVERDIPRSHGMQTMPVQPLNIPRGREPPAALNAPAVPVQRPVPVIQRRELPAGIAPQQRNMDAFPRAAPPQVQLRQLPPQAIQPAAPVNRMQAPAPAAPRAMPGRPTRD